MDILSVSIPSRSAFRKIQIRSPTRCGYSTASITFIRRRIPRPAAFPCFLLPTGPSPSRAGTRWIMIRRSAPRSSLALTKSSLISLSPCSAPVISGLCTNEHSNLYRIHFCRPGVHPMLFMRLTMKEFLLEEEDPDHPDGNRCIRKIEDRTEEFEVVPADKWHPG